MPCFETKLRQSKPLFFVQPLKARTRNALNNSQKTNGLTFPVLQRTISDCVPPNPLAILALRITPSYFHFYSCGCQPPRNPLPSQNGPISSNNHPQLPGVSDTLLLDQSWLPMRRLRITGRRWGRHHATSSPRNPQHIRGRFRTHKTVFRRSPPRRWGLGGSPRHFSRVGLAFKGARTTSRHHEKQQPRPLRNQAPRNR